MFLIKFKDTAVENIQRAYNYLEEKEKNLGMKFLGELTEYLEILETNPYIFKSGYREVRQVRIKPFQ